MVVSQNPGNGKKVEEGTSVDIVISLGEEPKNYRYTGQVTVQCPFDDETEEGTISLVLSQSGRTKTIFNKRVKADNFPLSVSFDGYAEGSGVVAVYWNGDQVDSYSVTLEKVEE